MKLVVKNVTQIVYEWLIQKVTVPTAIGGITVLPHHMSLATIITEWVVQILPKLQDENNFIEEIQQEKISLSVKKGFMHIKHQEVNILLTK